MQARDKKQKVRRREQGQAKHRRRPSYCPKTQGRIICVTCPSELRKRKWVTMLCVLQMRACTYIHTNTHTHTHARTHAPNLSPPPSILRVNLLTDLLKCLRWKGGYGGPQIWLTSLRTSLSFLRTSLSLFATLYGPPYLSLQVFRTCITFRPW
jgi:hypothetical protein